MLPLLWVTLGVGFMLGHWEAGIDLRGLRALGWALLAWTALHFGTMWLNAARDQDEGPVAFGQAVPVPDNAALVGILALVLCGMLALPGGPVLAGCAAAAALLSLAYSHPKIALKAHPVGGPVINMLGYGLLTPLAGMAAGGAGVSPRTVLVLMVMALGMGGLSFAAQAFQADEDRGRGDRTLVATHGPAATLSAARWLLNGAAVLALAGALAGWFPLACLVGVPLFIGIDRYMRQWAAAAGGGTPAHARRLVRRLLVLIGVLVVAAVVEHGWGLFHDQPPAGQNTRVVPEPWFVLPTKLGAWAGDPT